MAVKKSLAKKILSLWKDDKFPGSFTGLSNFRHCLYLYKKIHVSLKDLSEIMRKERNYAHQLTRISRFKRQNYINLNGYFDMGSYYF